MWNTAGDEFSMCFPLRLSIHFIGIFQVFRRLHSANIRPASVKLIRMAQPYSTFGFAISFRSRNIDYNVYHELILHTSRCYFICHPPGMWKRKQKRENSTASTST